MRSPSLPEVGVCIGPERDHHDDRLGAYGRHRSAHRGVTGRTSPCPQRTLSGWSPHAPDPGRLSLSQESPGDAVILSCFAQARGVETLRFVTAGTVKATGGAGQGPASRPGWASRQAVSLLNSSPEVIRLIVMMYMRFPLSLRNVEDLLFERAIDVCHETVRL
jgi:hypothetical protein